AMLTAPRTFAEIARVGPIRRQATKVSEMLADPERTGYVAVALPEEMPVNETVELEGRLHEAVGLGLDAILVNGVWPQRFSAADLRGLKAGEDGDMVRAALTSHARAKAQQAQIKRLRAGTDAPVHTLPFLFEAELGIEGYERLAAELERIDDRA